MAKYLIAATKDVPANLQVFNRQTKTRRKVAKVVLYFVLIFAICFLPNHIFGIWFYFDPNSNDNYNNYWHAVRIIGFCLSFMNSCINPIALYCVSGTFRKFYNQYLFCWICKEANERPAFQRQGTMTGSRYHSTVRVTDSIEISTLIPDRHGMHMS